METPLKRLRQERGLTAIHVSEQIGIDQGHYSRIENGGNTTPDTAEKIVRFFGQAFITEIQVLYPDRFMEPERPKSGAGRHGQEDEAVA